jgi:hypothetical protein
MLGIIIHIWTEAEYFHEVPKLAVNITNDGDRLGFNEYVGFMLDDIMKANDNVFDELKGDRFFLVEAFLEVGNIDLSIGGLEVLNVYRLLFLHEAKKKV